MRKRLRESRMIVAAFRSPSQGAECQLTISKRPRVERGARACLAPARALLVVHGGRAEGRRRQRLLHGGAGERDRHGDWCQRRRLFQLRYHSLSVNTFDC